jgi:hypothetical protein
MVDLGTLGGTRTLAVEATPSGQIAGWSNTIGDATVHAGFWERHP